MGNDCKYELRLKCIEIKPKNNEKQTKIVLKVLNCFESKSNFIVHSQQNLRKYKLFFAEKYIRSHVWQTLHFKVTPLFANYCLMDSCFPSESMSEIFAFFALLLNVMPVLSLLTLNFNSFESKF